MEVKVVSWLRANHLMMPGVKPPECFEICHDLAVSNSSGASGVLVRNRETGLYWLWSMYATYSVDQREARKIHEDFQKREESK